MDFSPTLVTSRGSSHALSKYFSHLLTRKIDILSEGFGEETLEALSLVCHTEELRDRYFFPQVLRLRPELLELRFNIIAAQQGVPSGNQLLDQGFIYQEDYDSKHFSKLLWPFKGEKKRGVWGTN